MRLHPKHFFSDWAMEKFTGQHLVKDWKMQLLRVHIPENVLRCLPKFSWSGLRSSLVMRCLAMYAPLENLRSCDRSMQSLSCADGCLAGDMYLDVWHHYHDIIITSFLHHYYSLLQHHYYILLHPYYVIITSLLCHYYVIITSLLHHYYIIITHYYNFIITSLHHYYIKTYIARNPPRTVFGVVV